MKGVERILRREDLEERLHSLIHCKSVCFSAMEVYRLAVTPLLYLELRMRLPHKMCRWVRLWNNRKHWVTRLHLRPERFLKVSVCGAAKGVTRTGQSIGASLGGETLFPPSHTNDRERLGPNVRH